MAAALVTGLMTSEQDRSNSFQRFVWRLSGTERILHHSHVDKRPDRSFGSVLRQMSLILLALVS